MESTLTFPRTVVEAAWCLAALQGALLVVLGWARWRVGPAVGEARQGALPFERGQPLGVRAAHGWIRLFPYLVFPLYYVGFVAVGGILPGFVFVLLALGVALEHQLPYRPQWNKLGRQEVNDVLHLLFSAVPGEQVGRMLVYACLPYVSGQLPLVAEGRLWPSGLSFPIQVALALVLFEAGNYALHYASHHVGWLWSFHRLHHTSERITMTKGFRRNIQEATLEATLALSTAALFGVPAGVLHWLASLQISGTIFSHANVQMAVPAWLQRIVITPAVHRIHHSLDVRYGNSNYGTALMIFDVMFGTFTDPNTHALGELGMAGNTVPVGFLKQWLCPFLWKRLDAEPVKFPGGE